MSRGEAITPKCRTSRRAYSTPAEQTAPASGGPDGCDHAGTSRFQSSTPQVADIGKFSTAANNILDCLGSLAVPTASVITDTKSYLP